MNESMVFYKSFYEAIKWLPLEEQVECYQAILEYGLEGILPEITGAARAVFECCKAQIDANNRRRENGNKGGRPVTKTEPNDNLTETKPKPNHNQTITKDNLTETKPEPNVNVNVNDNVNVNANDNANDNANENVNVNANDINNTCPSDEVVEILDYLNSKTGKSFKASSKANRQWIQARLKEGYTVADFRKVIDNKCKEWLKTSQEQYLRPETLFRPSHFESYLNQSTGGNRVNADGTITEGSIRIHDKNSFNQFDQHDYNMSDLNRLAKMGKKVSGNG